MKPIHLVVTLLAGCVIYLIQDRISTGRSSHVDDIEQAKSDVATMCAYVALLPSDPEAVQVDVKSSSVAHAKPPERTLIKVQPISTSSPAPKAKQQQQPNKATSTQPMHAAKPVIMQPASSTPRCVNGVCYMQPSSQAISNSNANMSYSYEMRRHRRR